MDVRKEQSACTHSHAPNYTFQANDNGKLTDSNHPGLSITAVQIQIWASLFCFFDHENIKVNPRSPFDLLPSVFGSQRHNVAPSKVCPIHAPGQIDSSKHFVEALCRYLIDGYSPDSLLRHSSIKPHFNVVRHVDIDIQ